MAYSRTIDSPEKRVADAKREREETAAHENTQKSVTAARRAFEAAQREWRASRPEYRVLCKGVKSELPDAELLVLAAAAGCSGNEIVSLKTSRRRALGMRDLAAQFAAAKKDFDRLEKEFLELEKQLDGAKTHGEAERTEGALYARRDALSASRRHVAETQLATDIVKNAKIAGLI
ncbi:MAG: hypothetical protein GX594_17100 [Pirellulaceae bacterium]|nr:hypothetical protein [Pirellulaceae bacterium]